MSGRKRCCKVLRSEKRVILSEAGAPSTKKEEVGWFVSASNAFTRKENGFSLSPSGREHACSHLGGAFGMEGS